MRIRTRLLMSAAAIFLVSNAAQAADVPPITVAPPPPAPVVVPPPAGGPYITIFGGILDIPPVDAEVAFDPPTIFVDPDLGFRAGGAVGYAVGNFGFEFEGTYGRAHLGSWGVVPGPGLGGPFPDDAFATLISLMGNLNIGFSMGAMQPFVAVGGGAVRVGIDVPAGVIGADDAVGTDWTWGAQVMAGANFAVSDALSIGARYRYQYIGPTAFEDGGGDPILISPFGTHGFELTITLRR